MSNRKRQFLLNERITLKKGDFILSELREVSSLEFSDTSDDVIAGYVITKPTNGNGFKRIPLSSIEEHALCVEILKFLVDTPSAFYDEFVIEGEARLLSSDNLIEWHRKHERKEQS